MSFKFFKRYKKLILAVLTEVIAININKTTINKTLSIDK